MSYDVAASRDKNPLFKALKGKVRQLKDAPSEALRLIIACDGGCALMGQSPYMRSPGTYNSREVTEDFLRQNSSIDAVLLVTIDEHRQVLGNTTTYRMKYDLVVAPLGERSQRMTSFAIAELEKLLRGAAEYVAQPVRSAYNAAIRCRIPGCGPDMLGAYKVSGNKVSISSRALQRLLAGELTAHDFIEAHSSNGSSLVGNLLTRSVQLGQMITKVDIESAGDKDDDWITFTFGSPDPAAAPFRAPLATPATSPDDKGGEP